VQKGQKVKAGQVLAYLDKREADALLEKARAQAAREREAVDEAARKLRRLREMGRTGGASTQAVEDAETDWRAARARLRVAEAELSVAKIHREKIEITAPFAGVITKKTAEVGQWLEAGTPLFTLVANAGREIEANVDAGDSGIVAVGQTVTVTCDAFPGRAWRETVHWIAPAITADEEDAINTFAVRMTLGPDAPPLLLGQQVDVRIRTARKENVLKLPYGALLDKDDRQQVAVVRDGRVKLVDVSTGIDDFSHIEIVTGLNGNEDVILPQGRKTLENGMAVQIRRDTAQP
jgi:membrane fusion protein (multidrug efflux system)